MRIRKKVVLLLAAALAAAGLSAVPAASAASDPGSPVGVHGLKGEYYTQSAPGAFDFGQLKATGFDPDIDFLTLESRLSSATGQADNVSVRWTGKIVPEKTGAHVFSMIGDNGFRLWIDGKPVIDHWVDDWEKEQTSQPVELTAGQAYDLKIEFFEHQGGSNLHLKWTDPGGTKEPVPQSAFRLPDDFAYDGAIAATVLADGRTLKLDVAQKLAPLPAQLANHTVNPSAAARAEYEHEMKEMIDEHSSHPSVVMWVTFNEGWGQYDQARIADQAKSWDPTRLVNNMSGLNCCGAVDGGNGDIADAHGYPSPALAQPDGKRALVSGEYGGLGLAVPGHAWAVQQSYIAVDPATYTDDYLARLDEVRKLACKGSSGAVYTQISDVEGELNGLLTYDRRIVKPDMKRIKAAQDALVRDASNPVVAGCPTA
ncbi:PA14 domain-containing protein [Streptomyces sp. NPDC005181]|uniref:PA14 domain-containing protein n=1 Tax=Streptomyces sp. NPDC005181 TaxID=3156869 RepID=UPI0033A89074